MRSFYKSFITSSVICFSLASASSVLQDAQTSATSSTSLSATTPQVTPQDDLTSFTDRLKVVREYYGEKPFNSDRGIFTDIAKWHDQDVKAIASRLTSEENRAKLQNVAHVMTQTFARGEASFAKVSAAYLLYARFLSRDLEPCTDSAILDYHAKQNQSVLRYIQDGSLDGFYNQYLAERHTSHTRYEFEYINDEYLKDDTLRKDEAKSINNINRSGELFFRFENILELTNRGIRLLPMVSKTGEASFDELHESFGLGTPLLGFPLGYGDYDGNLHELPEEVIGHDIKHARFNDFNPAFAMHLPERYKFFRKGNNIVREIPSKEHRALAQYMLFEFGHEHGFTDQNDDMSVTYASGLKFPVMKRADKFKVFDKFISQEMAHVENNFTESVSFESLWAGPGGRGYATYSNGEEISTSCDEKFYRTRSALRHLVDQATGKIYSLEQSINVLGLDKTQPLGLEHFIKALPILGETIAGDEHLSHDLEHGIHSPLQPLLGYNTLIHLQTYFQQNGFPEFQIWKGDKINIEGIKEQLQKAVEVFKTEVLPRL